MRCRWTLVVLFVAIGAACGADDQAEVGTGTDPTPPVSAADPPVRAVFVASDESAKLFVSLDCIRVPPADGPSPIVLSEEAERVILEVDEPVLDPPCNPVQVEVQLQAPLGGRAVVDDTGSELPVHPYVAPDPSRLVPAECTEEAARAVVANDVDGGLRSELLGCHEGWMAVRTSTDACAATGEEPAEGCIGNAHTVYWRNTNGHWSITGFDDCDSIRRQYPGPPPTLCQSHE